MTTTEAAFRSREVGAISEADVVEMLEDHKKRRSLVAGYKLHGRGSIEDDTGRDITVYPLLKLPVLAEFYIQVKTSRTGEDEFREKVLVELEGRLVWIRRASERDRRRMIDQELLKRKIIVLVTGEGANLDADFDLKVRDLYAYWQDRWKYTKAAKDRRKLEKERSRCGDGL